jgi:hypothetical protein
MRAWTAINWLRIGTRGTVVSALMNLHVPLTWVIYRFAEQQLAS